MRALALLAGLTMASSTPAAILTWPGPAPCDTTLGACIFNADPSDIVRIASNTVDNGVSIVNKSLTLEAAPGFLPLVAEGEDLLINFTDGGNYSVTVRGLQFASGQLQVFHSEGDGSVLFERNRFQSSFDDEPSIWVTSSTSSAGTSLDYTVRYNTIDNSTQTLGAIRVQSSGTGSNTMDGVIEGNDISVSGSGSRGIAVYEYASGGHTTRISGNTIEGASSRGIDLYNHTDGGGIFAFIYSNIVYQADPDNPVGEGIALWSFGALVNAWVVNNTLIGNSYGLVVREGSGGATESTAANNIFARNFSAWLVVDEATFSERHNLFHDNIDEPDSIDATSMFANPLLHPNLPGRIRAGSPAIDAGDNAATSTLPGLDVRGYPRYVNGTTDIGAVEYGNHWLVARKPTSSGNNFIVNSPHLDGQPGEYPQVTALWNPYGQGGIYNDANEGIYYTGGLWRIFNESVSDTMAQGAAFWVFVPGSSLLAGSRSNTSASSSMPIDWPATNNQPQRILSVTQHWNRTGPGVYNNHPFGVFYAASRWRIANLDSADIPDGADFNLFTVDPSQNAFEHIARGANLSGHITQLFHPLLDGNPCARMQVTQSANQGVFNAHPIGVFYTGSRWAIYNQDLASMAENAAFHVIVDADSGGCGLFSDRFRAGGF